MEEKKKFNKKQVEELIKRKGQKDEGYQKKQKTL